MIAREIEAWFLADWETTSGLSRCPPEWPKGHPEEIVDAKERLRERLGGQWNQIVAAKLSRELDLLRVARRCDRWRGLDRFVEAVGGRLS